MKMRLLVSRKQNGYAQMAMDEAILESIIEKQSPETIRFFDFSPPAITIGRLQNISEVNLQRCKKEGIVIVRRLTGGRAVIHSGDFTFSFIIRKDNPVFQGNVYETYKKISYIFLEVITSLGIPAEWKKGNNKKPGNKETAYIHKPLCFSATTRYELTVRERKVLGVAQYRKKNGLLVQGSMLLRKPYFDFYKLFDGYSQGDIFYLSDSTDIDFEQFSELLIKNMRKIYNIELYRGELSDYEKERQKQLLGKYRMLQWEENYKPKGYQ